MSKLYVCATPIGNLQDVSLRLLAVLREVALIAAEDTRRTRRLCAHYDIQTTLISCHEHNERERAEQIVAQLEQGRPVAYVTDAGTPGISDPGARLVDRVHAAGFTVVPIPGPSAVTAALSAAGYPADAFLMLGFLPRKGRDRDAALRRIAEESLPVVIFEAPQRINATMADLAACLGERNVCVARELTKQHETIRRGSVRDLAAAPGGWPERGEYVLVIGPGSDRQRLPEKQTAAQLPLAAEVKLLVASGLPEREAIRRVARGHDLSTRTVYEHLHGLEQT